jgi:hypothetical protein
VCSLMAGSAIEHHESSINFHRRHTKTNSFTSHRMAKVQIARKIVLFSHFCRPDMPNFQQQEQKLLFFNVIRQRLHDAKSEGGTEAHATLGRKTSVLTIG